MQPSIADFSTILDRILDTAAENLRVAKILIQMGLDPNNITYDALFNRLLDIALANITLANMLGLVGAIFFVATLLMQTMVPLRVANMAGCTFVAAYGALSGNVATFLLYLLLLPINAIRLRQMLKLVKKARTATRGDMPMEWLKPFMTECDIAGVTYYSRRVMRLPKCSSSSLGSFWSRKSGSSFRLDVSWENLDSLRPITDEPRRSSASKKGKS
jgi:hypothetical protein